MKLLIELTTGVISGKERAIVRRIRMRGNLGLGPAVGQPIAAFSVARKPYPRGPCVRSLPVSR